MANLIFFAIGLAINLFIIKWSAGTAYKHGVNWTGAFLQWILLTLVQILFGVFLLGLTF
ncbi:MAG: hypothetical protein Q7S92_05955 [Candidatus Diapherotrites archaeon]|nr:hypothetical protein [Candidatus Diapherotrites archaeon]